MRRQRSWGYSLIELIFVIGLVATLSGFAIPLLLTGLDNLRAAGAARYMSARLHRARMEAVVRSRDVAIQFTATSRGYTFAMYADGNRNGVLTRDIQRGIDQPLGQPERLGDNFAGVEFGAVDALPPVDPGGTAPGSDPIRIGTSGLLTFTPLGTSSSGTLYIVGRHNAQYAVRILGTTGRIRVLKYEPGSRQWKPL
jgi:type II secretory pathway pseudopilin PulG